jgi:predicted TIM-barrel fold metal-dependent hydrolase
MPILDIHAHIYPDAIAQKAAASIGDFYQMPIRYDGTLDVLLKAEAAAGISRALVHSVAVTWEKAERINDFIAGAVHAHPGILTGFATLHPDHPHIGREIERAISLGLKGVKLHPDFQHFNIDDERAFPIYEAMEGRLPLLIHTGDNRYETSQPIRMARVLDKFPKLQTLCAHLGGWSEWREAHRILAGRPNLWVDTSSSLYALTPDAAREVILHYGVDRVLFGTDYPMWDPSEELTRLKALGFGPEDMELILYKNAQKLLGEAA